MKEIDLKKSEQYILSIRLSADGFSFSIHHPQNEDVSYTSYAVNSSYSMTANVKKMLATMEELGHSYQAVNILIDTPRFTLVPFDLFEDEQTEEFFHLNFPKKENETILCNILGKNNVALLFGVDKHTHQLLAEQFPNARIFACISPLLEYFHTRSREHDTKNLYAHFHGNRMEVFAFEKGKLLLTNTFPCKHTPDKVYYMLYIWQQLGFSQEKDQIYLSGGTNIGKDLPTELSKFLRQVTLLPTENNLPFDLQTLMTCE
jgi:hypothetical protein